METRHQVSYPRLFALNGFPDPAAGPKGDQGARIRGHAALEPAERSWSNQFYFLIELGKFFKIQSSDFIANTCEDYLRIIVEEGLVVGRQAIGRLTDDIGLFKCYSFQSPFSINTARNVFKAWLVAGMPP